ARLARRKAWPAGRGNDSRTSRVWVASAYAAPARRARAAAKAGIRALFMALSLQSSPSITRLGRRKLRRARQRVDPPANGPGGPMTAPRFLRPALAACLLSASLPLEGNAASGPTPQPATPPARPTLDAIFAPGGAGRAPTQAAWSPDGRRLTYLWKDE